MIQALLTYAPQITEVFDVLVVDEGQDMDAAWIAALIPMVKPIGRITLLEDPGQGLYDRTGFRPENWPLIESPVNYRSPRLLVDFMNYFGLTDHPIEAGSGILGFDPVWRWYEDSKTLIDETEDALKTLMEEGYAPENIAILTYQGLANSLFFSKGAPRGLNNVRLKRQDRYDSDGKVKYTDGKVLLETLYRFKGQAADAVILTEIDFEELDAKNRRKLFVAFSRARLHLVFITSERARDVLLAKTNEA